MSEQQRAANVYVEALGWITEHPGTGSANSLAKLVLSLWNSDCAYPVSDCLGNLDGRLRRLVVRMVQRYAEHGEEDDLRAVGKAIDARNPRLSELGPGRRKGAAGRMGARRRGGSARLYPDG